METMEIGRKVTGETEGRSERRCVLTRCCGPCDRMIRLVMAPDGVVVPDIDGSLPGRGAWISADREAFEAALAKGRLAGALAHGLKTRVAASQIPADMPVRIDSLLVGRVCNRLGLERRAGRLVAGFEAVRQALVRRPVRVLLEASDAAVDGRRKLRARSGPDIAVFSLLTRAQMSLALGRENVVHAAVENGGGAERLIRDLERLASWRGEPETEARPTSAAFGATEANAEILDSRT